MLKRLLAAIGLLAITMTVPASAQSPTPLAAEDLHGVWRIVSLEVNNGGTVTTPYGAAPDGYLVFADPHRFHMFIVDPERPRPASAQVTDAEAGVLFRRMTAWAASFTIDPAQTTADGTLVTVTVDASANQLLTGTTRGYYYRIDGDRLIGRSVPQPFAQTGLTSVTVSIYERVR